MTKISMNSVPVGTQNIAVLSGVMNIDTTDINKLGGWITGLKNQITDILWQAKLESRPSEDWSFVLCINSQASVDADNELRIAQGDEANELHLSDEERFEIFNQIAQKIGAVGVIVFDEPVFGDMFEELEITYDVMAAIKNGYTPDGIGKTLVCPFLKKVEYAGGMAVSRPPFGGLKPTMAETHMSS